MSFTIITKKKTIVVIKSKILMIIPRKKSNRSAIQIHFSAYQSSLHLSRTSDLRSCLTASLTNEAGSELQQSRGCKATSVSSPDSFCGKVDSMARNSGSEQTDCRGFQCGIINTYFFRFWQRGFIKQKRHLT